MKTFAWLVSLSIAILVLALPVLAHHSFSMFDMEKEVAYKGTVVEYKWVNPHVHMTFKSIPIPAILPQSGHGY